MCGIVGYIGNKKASDIIISGLKRLEYRGYDSAGIATIINGDIDEKKCQSHIWSQVSMYRQNSDHFGQSSHELDTRHLRIPPFLKTRKIF